MDVIKSLSPIHHDAHINRGVQEVPSPQVVRLMLGARAVG